MQYESWNHFRKRDLRLTPYLIGHIFHIEAIKLFYLQVLLLFPLFIYLSLKTIYQLCHDTVTAFWGTLTLLFCYLGNSFYYDTLFFDSYAYLGLLAAFWMRRHWTLIPILLATYFIDERSLAPSLVILLANHMERSNLEPYANSLSEFRSFTWQNTSFWTFLILGCVYACIRIYLYLQYQLQTPIGSNSGVQFLEVMRHKSKVPLGIFSAFKLDLLFIFLVMNQLLKMKKLFSLLIYLVLFGIIMLISTAVEDVTRSLAFGFPLLLIYFQLLPESKKDKADQRLFVALVAIANALLPTYTLLLNLLRVEAFGWTQLF